MKYRFPRFPGGKAKAVTLSYDDGSNDDAKLLDIIDKYGIKCTFNLVGSSVGEGRRLSREYVYIYRAHTCGGKREVAPEIHAHQTHKARRFGNVDIIDEFINGIHIFGEKVVFIIYLQAFHLLFPPRALLPRYLWARRHRGLCLP